MNHAFIRKLEKTPQQNIVIILTGVAAIATIIFFLLMHPTEMELKSVSPYGILELEFAWTEAKVTKIFSTWGSELIVHELNVTFIDYGFLLAYSTFFAGFTLLIPRKLLSGQIQIVGFYMTLIPFIAALFDSIENLNLILMLSSPSNFPMFSPFFASIFATLKFSLLIIVIIFWVVIDIWYLYQRFIG